MPLTIEYVQWLMAGALSFYVFLLSVSSRFMSSIYLPCSRCLNWSSANYVALKGIRIIIRIGQEKYTVQRETRQ